MDDDAWRTRLALGEQSAFVELYDACADQLFAFLRATLGNSTDAADVMQETFARVVRSRTAFERIENPVAYVFVCARHEATRWREKARRRKHVAFDPEQAAQSNTGSAAEHAANDSEELAVALAGLPDELREVVHLKVYVGLKFREIAELLDCPQGTVASRYRAALERLRRHLGFAPG